METPRPKALSLRLPTLAVVTLVFLGLSTNTHLDAATVTLPASLAVAPQTKSPLEAKDTDPTHVLSLKDAALYRAAFAAQEQADWKSADEAMAQIKDKKLIGHILADRYQRHSPTLVEAQQWLTSYADLPEAETIYDQAKHLHGFSAATFTHPVNTTSWTGNGGSDAAAGFHSPFANDNISKLRIDFKINDSLRHGDPMTAKEILATEWQRGTLSINDSGNRIGHIAAAFFYQGEIERARPMAHLAASTGVPIGLWIDGLSAWKQKDYLSATRSFASLAQVPGLSSWDRAAASYWAYRAARRSGDKPQANHWLTEAAKYPRSFYGYMAAQVMGNAPGQSWVMPELNTKNIAVLLQRPAGWQALALVQIGKNDLAESELRRLNPSNRDMQTAILALAEKAQMPSLTLQLAGKAANDNKPLYEAALYPLPPWQPANGFKVERALMFALMKHESQFDPEAVSDRGACGLMQIMPSTARRITNDNDKGRDCPDRLFDPATNMEMGQKYVRVLAGEPAIGNNLLFLLTAYNAGPGNLSHWLDGNDRADPLLFIESLPMRETRDYVQQVLLHYWMYRSRLSEPETTSAQLARGEWPRYALRDDGLKTAETSGLEVASR